MKIVIYNPNSKGGNFDYARRLLAAYKEHASVSEVQLILPSNALVEGKSIYKILLSDQPPFHWRWVSRVYFVFRSLINPLLFFKHLKKQSGYVIFNDFDQLSGFLWVPFFSRSKIRFVFAAILHDPDRDRYFRNKSISSLTMKKVMSLMDVAFYHDVLPERTYFDHNKVKFVPIPHGLYFQESEASDDDFFKKLNQFKNSARLIGAIGNIRREKNYELLLMALKQLPDLKLFIGGIPSNSSVDIESIESLVTDTKLKERVLLIQKYLTNEELQAVGKVCDGFIMYYAHTFKSQSGVLNLVAPYGKPLLVSDANNPLSNSVRKFQLGLRAKEDSLPDLVAMLERFNTGQIPDQDWSGYYAYASWENHVNIALEVLRKIKR